jgi:hypothetical protein
MGVVQRIGKEMMEARSCDAIFAGATAYIELQRMMTRQPSQAHA